MQSQGSQPQKAHVIQFYFFLKILLRILRGGEGEKKESEMKQ